MTLGADGAPAREIQLFPIGRIDGRDGRGPWVLADEAHAREVVAATQAYHQPQQMMGDYDHQLPFNTGPGKGGRAEAAGWIDVSTLTVKPDGIWAAVDWTAEAAEKLKARLYRYVSPYFGSDKETGRVTRIFNFGLVNQPNIRELAAAASASLQPGNAVSMKTLLTALGLKDDATEAEACAAIDTLKLSAASAEHLSAAGAALGLKAEATGEEVVAAATAAVAGKADMAKFVPIETHQAATTQLKVINEERAAAAVDKAIEAGKLAPANRDWGLNQFLQDETAFAAFVQGQPVILDPKARPLGKVETGKTVLSDEDRAACAALGVSEEDFLKTRESEAAQ